jgi:methyl-accepting chemotaxis protein
MTGEAAGASSRASASLDDLRARAAEIDEFVEMVRSIADQTNLLALNATIEAARAGEAGRGFSVVANEVKTLAGQTNKATTDIAERVEALRGASARTDEELRSVGEVVTRLAGVATSIAAAMEEQSAATDEIARNVQEAATGNDGVSEVISHVADAASRSDVAAGQIADGASELVKQANQLQDRVTGFLAQLRAA